jgi:formate dehydrogenase subunit gamma
MIILLLVLLITGIMLWQPYFASMFPIPLRRLAALGHALAGIGLMMGVIIHIYAAIWVQGTLRAMLRGTVSAAWARKNHPEWYKEEMEKEKS